MKEKYFPNLLSFTSEKFIILLTAVLAIIFTTYFFSQGAILAYGDSESHLNISKRLIHSLTPGFAQFGGIWLPLPHALMAPFVYFDYLWRSGLAGSLVSGASFIIASLFIYKLTYLVTNQKLAAFFAFALFALNPNILYMQSTPMTELPLLAFFSASSYFFIKFMINDSNYLSLLFAGIFGFFATITRYDGWFLVAVEALILVLMYIDKVKLWKVMEGKLLFFSTMAFFGILLWFLWDFLILGDPFYFTNSPFSAKSQQAGWLLRGELPAYKDISLSALYYLDTAMRNVGGMVFGLFLVGLVFFLFKQRNRVGVLLAFLMLVPFIFYTVTLYIGQSVIFIPDLTPENFEWKLFNVRYGILALPAIVFFASYLFSKSHYTIKSILAAAFIFQTAMFVSGYTPIITLDDGIYGLSSSKVTDAQYWMASHYDKGLVLIDDYARTMSIIRSNIPMENVIYVGNKPYWEESLIEPEKYATWIVLQKDDAVWKALNENPVGQGRLFKYFQKVYTSPEILIFKRSV